MYSRTFSCHNYQWNSSYRTVAVPRISLLALERERIEGHGPCGEIPSGENLLCHQCGYRVHYDPFVHDVEGCPTNPTIESPPLLL